MNGEARRHNARIAQRGAPLNDIAVPRWLAAALIVVLTVAAYSPVLLYGGFIWDDDSYVTENSLLWEKGGLRRIWWPDEPFHPRAADADSLRFARVWFKPETPQYYPMIFSTFWVEYRLWGLSPRGYHAVNVLLHAASAVLLWLVLARLKVPGAWLIGAVFALHPVNVESVAWITERKNTLSLLFYLLAAMAYLRFDRALFGWQPRGGLDSEGNEVGRSNEWGWYALSLGVFVLALLSKSVTCSLPAALILVLVWLRVPLTPKRLAPLAPFFVIGFVLAMNTALIERELVGARGPDFDFNFAERTIIATHALTFYASKLIWPHPLMFIYPRWEINQAALVQYLPLLLWMMIGVLLLWLLIRGVRGPFVAMSLFAGTAFPALGYFNVYPHIFSFVADHFIYHASIGFLVLVVGGAVHLLRRYPQAQNGFAICSAMVLAVFLVLTARQSSIYQSAESVYRDTIDKNPAAWMPHNNLSTILIERAATARETGEIRLVRALADEAIRHADASIATRPENHRPYANRAEALRLLERYREALESISKALQVVEEFNESEGFHIEYTWQRGRILHHLGRYDEAIDEHLSAVARDPDHPTYRHDLAVAYLALERWQEAAEQFEAIHEMRPSHYPTIMRLSGIHQRAENHLEAERFLRMAVETAPSVEERFGALARLIRVLATAPDPRVRDNDEAIELATEMARMTGFSDPGILHVLASVYGEAGEIERAVEVANDALSIARRLGLRDIELMLIEQLQQFEVMSE